MCVSVHVVICVYVCVFFCCVFVHVCVLVVCLCPSGNSRAGSESEHETDDGEGQCLEQV